MASPARPKSHQSGAPVQPLWKLTDDLLADILIRLPTLADLGRASAACPTFRRVIAARSFLRRIRAVHTPPLLGTLSGTCGPDFFPAQPPHPSAAVARAFAEAADFSCSFLPSPDRCRYRDFRDGRALVSRVPEGSIFPRSDYDRRALVKEFIVCDLLRRRYLILPAIPDHLTTFLDCWVLEKFHAFLAPSSEDEDGTSFRVICVAECTWAVDTKLVIFNFSSDGGQWHAAEFEGWRALTSGLFNSTSFYTIQLPARDYAHGCFCWVMPWRNKLLVLDTRTMECATVDIPPANPWRRRAIVEAEDGRFGMFIVCFDRGTCILAYFVLQNDVQNANHWQSKAMIQLPLNYTVFNILGVAGGYLLLLGIPSDHFRESIPFHERPNMDCFSLNLKTFQIDWFCTTRYLIEDAPLYAGFPPSLSPPTI